ncbi:MAG: alpha/beta hydrolase [Chloroflexi bacterium]|nr:alpha/beta hydrolase [Chloroflexota bacterium]
MEFAEHFVDADGFHIRYQEAGQGEPLISLHGGGGLRISGSHQLLAERYRVIAFETPGFGASAENTRSQSMQDLAETMAQAASALGLDKFNLWGNSFGGKLALWLAVLHPEHVQALVLAAPAAFRPEGSRPRTSVEQQAGLMYAHPERQPAIPPLPPEIAAKQQAFASRVIGPPRDPELERRLTECPVPTLVVFGTLDTVVPPEMGRLYREMMPNAHLTFVYDAAHAVDADRPEAFASLVTDFLTRHEQFIVKRESALINP